MNTENVFNNPHSPKKKIWIRRHPILTVIGVIFIIGILSSGSGSDDSSSTSTSQVKIEDRKTTSVVFAENVIEGILKAPSTAKFVDVRAYELSSEKDVWAVNGYVDSQNSFGAMIRNTWEVQLDYRDGKGGTVKSILFDGEKVQ